MNHEDLIKEFEAIEPDQLRSMSGQSMYLDSDISPGARFLKDVRDAALEVIEQGPHADRWFELTISIGDIVACLGTHEAWETWLDLTGYTVDVSDFGDSDQPVKIEDSRNWALHEIANQLGHVIFSDYDNRIDEDDEAS